MSEFCYTLVCGHGEVAEEKQFGMTREFCSVFQSMLYEAGETSFLDTSPCPLVALKELTPRPTDSPEQAARRAQVAEKLIGISGIDSFEV